MRAPELKCIRMCRHTYIYTRVHIRLYAHVCCLDGVFRSTGASLGNDFFMGLCFHAWLTWGTSGNFGVSVFGWLGIRVSRYAGSRGLGGFHFRGHKASRSQGSGVLGHQGFRVFRHSGVQETTYYCMMVLGHCRVITVHNGFPRVVRAIRIIMVTKVIRIVRVIRVSWLLGH